MLSWLFSHLLWLDHAFLLFVNSLAHRYWTLDTLIRLIVGNELFKGGVVVAAIWWSWFRDGPHESRDTRYGNARDLLLYTLLICVPALLTARTLGHILFRPRPVSNPALHLRIAFGFDVRTLETWSTFPSDHAALFFGLSTGLFLVSRKIGWLMYAYSFFVICLPRILLGIHYPSDVLAGALLGIAAVNTVRFAPLRSLVLKPAQRLLAWSPSAFYAALFLLTWQTADLYDHLRHLEAKLEEVVRVWYHFLFLH